MPEIKEENWSSIRINEQELKDLHEIKSIVEKSTGKKLRLGEAISFALRQLKSGRFESMNVDELRGKIEVELKRIRFQSLPPSIEFTLEVDNRNTRELCIEKIEYKISGVEGYVLQYLPISILQKTEFGAVEKRVIQLMMPMDCFLLDFLHKMYTDGGGELFPTITIWVNLHFALGTGETAFSISEHLSQRTEASQWKHMIETSKKRFPKVLREYLVETKL